MSAPEVRPIRSFVRRSGRMTPGQRRALDALWSEYGLSTAPAQPGRVFETIQPCVLEIGFGNGEALLERARTDASRNYLGLEVHEPGVGHLLLGLAEHRLRHVRLLRMDASDALTTFEDASFTEICLWFPDPWPKKRHHKRRLVQAPFVAAAERALAPGGLLHFATDDADYAAMMREVMAEAKTFALVSEDRGGRPVTRFERRALALSRPIHDLRYQR